MSVYYQFLSLRLRVTAGDLPSHIALVITERDLLEPSAFGTLEQFFNWAFDYRASRVSVYVSVLDEAVIPTLERQFSSITTPREMAIRMPDDTSRADAPIGISIGLGGKHEFANAVRALAELAEAGELSPSDIDERDVEERLVFPADPDLVIKTGAERLSDFMIWQSVYSELYFTDVNWRDFRKRDYLRALLDFKHRQRRYGR